jgi:apolipoprotein N-acyltransferase
MPLTTQAIANSKDISLTRRFCLTFISALLCWMAYPGVKGEGLSWLVWVCLVPWGFALKGAKPRVGFILGFLFGFFVFFGVLPGVTFGLKKLLEVSDVKVWLLYVLCCSMGALPYALFGWAQSYFRWFEKSFGIARAAGYLALFVVVIPQVMPVHYYLVLYNSPIPIQIVDLGGVPLLLFIINIVNWYALDAVTKWMRNRNPLAPGLAFALLLSTIMVYGQYRLMEFHGKSEREEFKERIQIVSIQPNISLKSVVEDQSVDLEAVTRLSEQAIKQFPSADLFVLPELPRYLNCDEGFFQDTLASVAKKNDNQFLVQCDKKLGSSPSYTFSGVKLLSPFDPEINQGTDQEYHKIILFPFGEYLPFSETFPAIKNFFNYYRNYTPGSNTEPMYLNGMVAIPSICYEAIFSSHIRKFVQEEGDILINMTNDGWWGKSDGAMIHLALSVFRTVEYRVPLVRVTNSGVGAFVEATGEIAPGSMTPLFQEAVTSYLLFIPEKRSPYYQWGDWLLYGLLSLLAYDLFCWKWRKKDLVN